MIVKALASFWYNGRLIQADEEVEISKEDYEKLKNIVTLLVINSPTVTAQEDKIKEKKKEK